MDFRQLEVFCAIVEQKSFSGAAKKLYISQPTISSHLHNLEKELNTVLMERTTKTVIPTKDGMKLYEYAQSMLSLKKKALAEFNNDKKQVIQLGVSSIPSAYILPEILSEYLKKHEDIKFEITQADSLIIIEQLKNGSIDIGITGSAYSDDVLVCKTLCRDEMVLVTPRLPEFKAYRNNKTSIKKIFENHPYIDRESGSGTKKRADMYFESIGYAYDRLKVVAQMNDLEAIKKSIEKGVGISILSKKVAQDMEKNEKAYIFHLSKEGIFREYYLIYRKNRELPFAKYIEKNFRKGNQNE